MIDPYPSEYKKIHKAAARLQAQFINTPLTSSNQRIYEEAARNLFGEAGFVVSIEWKEIADAKTGASLGVSLPSISFPDRIKDEPETDHDRIKHEVTHGLDGGQPGFIREDGSWHEEPKKKLIT